MDAQTIANQIKLKNTQLQIADTSEKRQQIQKQLTVLKLKSQIEALNQRIQQLQAS
jgi:predicted  nucleic acid-binding Zn-ribbon protein